MAVLNGLNLLVVLTMTPNVRLLMCHHFFLAFTIAVNLLVGLCGNFNFQRKQTLQKKDYAIRLLAIRILSANIQRSAHGEDLNTL